MRAALWIALVAQAGCATTWIVTQTSGAQGVWDEQARDVSVPQPGIDERLRVELPLVDGDRIALGCISEQYARNAVYHSAFRYGGTWKKETGIMFLAESAIATVLLLTASDQHPGNYVYGGLLALDAAVTGAIFFIPRKEIYQKDDLYGATQLRSDCPDGLVLEIASESYPVDAAGHIGELGDAALAEWIDAPTGTLRASYAGQSIELPFGVMEKCAWTYARAPANNKPACAPTVAAMPQKTMATIAVPVGTLSHIATK